MDYNNPTEIIKIYLGANYTARKAIRETCWSPDWLKTTRRIKETFEEYITTIDVPVFARQLLAISLKSVEWEQVATYLGRITTDELHPSKGREEQ